MNIVEKIKRLAGSKRTTLVSGNFNVLHPGHQRLLQFAAECGGFLVVAINPDGSPETFIEQSLRLKNVQSVGCVNFAFILDQPLDTLIPSLKPDIVVKGREHRDQKNTESDLVGRYGGALLFSSGDVRLSSADLIKREMDGPDHTINRPGADYALRHSIKTEDVISTVRKFKNKRVVVIGDLIIDEYISCDPLGLSREDPTIVVTPIQSDKFLGGAGIIAAHAAGLGADVVFISAAGPDESMQYAREKLDSYGVKHSVVADHTRPTTLKQRYRANGKTLLRVSHLRQHPISDAICEKIFKLFLENATEASLVLFSDFNYGCLPQSLVDRITTYCIDRGINMAADSQSSSQIGDISRFKQMGLVTPTEHEARLALQDSSSGLANLASSLLRKTKATHVIITLGPEGVLIHSPESQTGQLHTDKIPALNTSPRDVAGAGDCFLICSALALTAGASIWESAYLGAIAAAAQVDRIGNVPISKNDLISSRFA